MDDKGVRTTARAVVVGLAVAFALQLAYVTVAEEPYPALMMPRFGWAGPSSSAVVEVEAPEIIVRYADAKTRMITQRELLDGVPDGHFGVIVGNLLAPLPPESASSRAPVNKYDPPTWLFPGYALARSSRGRPEHVHALADWLRRRARTLYPAAPPTRLTVNWYRRTYANLDGPERSWDAPTVELRDRFEVVLDAEPALRR